MTVDYAKKLIILVVIVFCARYLIKGSEALLFDPDVLWAQVLRGLALGGVIVFSLRKIGLRNKPKG